MNGATHGCRVQPYCPRVPATERSFAILEPLLKRFYRTLVDPKISELFFLSNFRKVSEACLHSLKFRWETRCRA
jgi:hypothetical protein